MAWKSSVQITSLGTQRLLFALDVAIADVGQAEQAASLRSQRILATARPTVPKPTRATRGADASAPEIGNLAVGLSGGVLCKAILESRKIMFIIRVTYACTK